MGFGYPSEIETDKVTDVILMNFKSHICTI